MTSLRSSIAVCVRTAALAAALLIVAPCAHAQEATTIKYKWAKGDVIRQRITSETKGSMTGGPMPDMTMTQSQATTYRMTVQGVGADGAATMEAVTESVKMDMDQGNGMKSSFDSTKPDAAKDAQHPMAATVGAMVNEPFTIVMAPDGSVRQVTGFEKILDKLTRAAEDGPGGAMGVETTKAMFSPEGLKQMMGGGLNILPSRPVKVGETWESASEMAVPMLGTMKTVITSTFTGMEKLDGVDAAKATSVLKSTLAPPKAGETNNPMAGAMKLTDGSGTGQMWFDTAAGRLRKVVMKMNQTMDLAMGEGATAIKMHMVNAITTTVEDLGDDQARK